MPEESDFHLTVVTQKRVPLHRPAQSASEQPSAQTQSRDSEPQHKPQSRQNHSRRERSAPHRRHYNDFGTVDLGNLNKSETIMDALDPMKSPSNGQVQREFYDKYNTVLSRRYQGKSNAKLARWLIIALLFGAVLILSLFGYDRLGGQTAETLKTPQVETIPIETFDLG